ncbi:AgmX/PglI C-terminal domain-containing protein [Halioxenophilus sp. WMMB6]|uniref:AgmX/PglI C-terminal domain-containing protein n=1 Tax=Halioxenophilus sp. WMMB6 TaxID=3073815 RepID=UPI00295EA8BC|nr:AgmX/PglI C-terminal domain-containing protein [Halioxenophilus sp. WMMB6]
MTSSIAEEKLALESQIATVEEQISQLNSQISDQDQAIAELQQSDEKFKLLDDICCALDKLEAMDAAPLFWGEEQSPEQKAAQLGRIQGVIADFQKQNDDLQQAKQSLQDKLNQQCEIVDDLSYQLDEVLDQEDRAQSDFIIEREEHELPFRAMTVPWHTLREDKVRSRKSFGGAAVFLVLLNLLILFWQLPEFDPEEVEVPEYLVEMVKKDKPIPQPPIERPKKDEPEPVEERKEEKKVADTTEKPQPTPEQKKAARTKAETSGVLAFKESFNELLEDDIDQKLGATANLRNTAAASTGNASRALVMSQATATSGGINNAAISRSVGGTAGNELGTGVSFARVDSSIGTDMVADDRPLSDGVGPTRTDEEIQIVFDRYKASLYRIYNRELRQNPFLKGKMVLRITIEPDGSVSVAKLENTDMDSQALVAEVLERVKRFNFGPKDGVPQITILYPIDFLPAA